jgi:hypothetical protein
MEIGSSWVADPADRELLDIVELGAKTKVAAAAAKTEQAILDEIEMKALRPYLKAELAAEMHTGGTREQRREDIEALRAYAQEWGLTLGLPQKPAAATLVAAFLANQSEHGFRHVKRLARSISLSHRILNLPDPTADLIVAAVMRQARHEKPASNGKGN